jgi:hypothetical protein
MKSRMTNIGQQAAKDPASHRNLWPFLVTRPFRFRTNMIWMTSIRTVLDRELLSERPPIGGRLVGQCVNITLVNGPLTQRNIVGVAVGDHPDLDRSRLLCFHKFAVAIPAWGSHQAMILSGLGLRVTNE